jgi:predicted transposase/invertase (TIGR01784 family)
LDYNSGIYAAFKDGKLEGILETQFETARKMHEKRFSATEIQEITGLSEADIRECGVL